MIAFTIHYQHCFGSVLYTNLIVSSVQKTKIINISYDKRQFKNIAMHAEPCLDALTIFVLTIGRLTGFSLHVAPQAWNITIVMLLDGKYCCCWMVMLLLLLLLLYHNGNVKWFLHYFYDKRKTRFIVSLTLVAGNSSRYGRMISSPTIL